MIFISVIIQVISAYCATLFFAILFQIPSSKIFTTGLGGALCWFSYVITQEIGFSTVFSAFIASLVASIYSEFMARFQKTPVTIYLVPSIIPLVPGAGMYNMMLAAIEQRFSDMLLSASSTFQTAAVIATSIVMVSSFAKILWKQ